MGKGPELKTARLKLRRWRKTDLEPFAAINADPAVMEHMPSALTSRETAHWIARIELGFEEFGFGLWVVEHGATGDFMGFTGLSVPRLEAHFTPAVEVGWRFAKEHWGNGYATEAARAALAFGFSDSRLDEIVSFTVPANARSISVMERLGMTNDPADDFEHPFLSDDPNLRRHVLYRMSLDRWTEMNRS
jgi:RimJ/RimL family protein N-acetyltransferase